MTIQRRTFARIAHVARVSECIKEGTDTVVVFPFHPESWWIDLPFPKEERTIALRSDDFSTRNLSFWYLNAYICLSILSYVSPMSKFFIIRGSTTNKSHWIIKWELKQRRWQAKNIVSLVKYTIFYQQRQTFRLFIFTTYWSFRSCNRTSRVSELTGRCNHFFLQLVLHFLFSFFSLSLSLFFFFIGERNNITSRVSFRRSVSIDIACHSSSSSLYSLQWELNNSVYYIVRFTWIEYFDTISRWKKLNALNR